MPRIHSVLTGMLRFQRRVRCRLKGDRRLAGENGMALVLTLVMLTIMSLLGVLALSSSSTEVGISGNYRSSQQAFYAAERAVEYAMTAQNIFDSIGVGNINLTGDYATDIAAGTGNSGLKSGATNQVSYLTSGSLPPGSGSDPTYFQARYYIITATGQGPNNSAAQVESQVARIVPK